jgi:hypothetical protein
MTAFLGIDVATQPSRTAVRIECPCGTTIIECDYKSGRGIPCDGCQRIYMIAHAARCVDCGLNWADPPSQLCPGCEAYREHTGQI